MKRLLLLIFCLLSFGLNIFGQEVPPAKAFTSKDYEAGNQNWGISHDIQNNIFFANNEGLLHYDGNNWKLYPSPNKTIMRSVLAVEDRIYTGCYMEFGYWTKDAYSEYKYTSLSDSIAGRLIEDEQFWGIQQVDEFVLFQSLDRIYIYDTQTENIEPVNSTGILKMFRQGSELYYQDNALDFYKVQRESAVKTQELGTFSGDRAIAVFPTTTGTLLLSQASGFYRLTPSGYAPWPTALDDLAADLRVYSAMQLKNGNYAIGTVADGLIILDQQGNLLAQFDQTNGLSNNTVLALHEDADSNLWAGLDNGIDVLNLEAPLNIYTDVNGNIGSVYTAVEYDGQMYLGTNQGLFYKSVSTNEPFNRVEGTNGQVWGLSVIDNTLFCAHNDGTIIVRGNRAELISDHSGTWTFLQLPADSTKILVGNYQGLSLLGKENDTWEFKGALEGFKYSSRFLLADDDGSYWINHEYKGVYNLQLDVDQLSVKNFVRDTTLPLGKNSGIVKYKDRLFYATEAGVYVKDNGGAFKKDSLLSKTYNAENQYVTGQLDTDNQDNLWLFGSNYIKLYGPSSFGRSIVMKDIALSADYRNQVIGFEEANNLRNGKSIIGTTGGYLLLDIEKFVPRDNTVYLSRAEIMNQKGERFPISRRDESFRFNYNSLHFWLNTPNYDTYLSKEFRYRLLGLRDQWGLWSEDNEIVLDNLPPGDYTLQAQSRVGLNPSTNTLSFKFEIAKPWYGSNTAVIIYIVTGLILMLLINETYKRYYRSQQNKLKEENERQLEIERLNSEKQRIALKNANLERDMVNKNQELAIATMGVARKNELLQGIKKDLDNLSERDEQQVLKKVKKIIESNINDANDWEVFQKAFNNVDKDFIKQLKIKYPNLTPNDLKLCTYLRLNLTSKEIAPLLNISVRSVEISRYRLRKKMALATEINLVDHILSI